MTKSHVPQCDHTCSVLYGVFTAYTEWRTVKNAERTYSKNQYARITIFVKKIEDMTTLQVLNWLSSWHHPFYLQISNLISIPASNFLELWNHINHTSTYTYAYVSWNWMIKKIRKKHSDWSCRSWSWLENQITHHTFYFSFMVYIYIM